MLLTEDKNMIEYTFLFLAVGVRINRVPVAELFWSPTPCSTTYKMALSTCNFGMETLPLCFGGNFSMTLNSFDVIFMGTSINSVWADSRMRATSLFYSIAKQAGIALYFPGDSAVMLIDQGSYFTV